MHRARKSGNEEGRGGSLIGIDEGKGKRQIFSAFVFISLGEGDGEGGSCERRGSRIFLLSFFFSLVFFLVSPFFISVQSLAPVFFPLFSLFFRSFSFVFSLLFSFRSLFFRSFSFIFPRWLFFSFSSFFLVNKIEKKDYGKIGT